MQPSLESLLRTQPASVSPSCICYASRRRGHSSRPRLPPNSLYVAPRVGVSPEQRHQHQHHASSFGRHTEETHHVGVRADTASVEPEDLAGARHSLERMFHLSELLNPSGATTLYTNSSNFPEFLPPTALLASLLDEKSTQPHKNKNSDRSPDYFANVGDAIRTLREDIPMLFQRDLNYEIYREDIVFRDPRNCFKGMKNYQTIFWSLQFHGKIFFKTLYVDVKRIWQPEDGLIKMRWTVHGIPRVPWEAEGTFDGISTYRLDHTGKIYEHSVDNVLLRDPPMATNPPLLAGLNLIPTAGQEPVPGAWFQAPPQEGLTALFQRLPWLSSMDARGRL